MTGKIVGAARFKADCLRLIDEMGKDHQPVTITRHGRPVAVLTLPAVAGPSSIVGAMKGSVLRYDDPFAPATDPADWAAV